MKTKTVSKNRKQSREFKANNRIARDLRGEFGLVLNNSFLDEDALAMCTDSDEYYY